MKTQSILPETSKIIKIIRIGGTAYSGSTMLDLMLSNADDAFSCGEVYAMYRPYRPHHFDPECGCSDPGCTIWQTVKPHGEERLWHTLSSLLPHVAVFVDSSKNLKWFSDQMRSYGGNRFAPFNVLIWKTPAEYAYSCVKRGEGKKWRQSYIDYHFKYFHSMNGWVSVRFADLARDPVHKLKKLCNFLGIPYFPGKEHYWEKQHHTLFGSSTAKLHLHKVDTPEFRRIAQNFAAYMPVSDINIKQGIEHHRRIYHEQSIEKELPLEPAVSEFMSQKFD